MYLRYRVRDEGQTADDVNVRDVYERMTDLYAPDLAETVAADHADGYDSDGPFEAHTVWVDLCDEVGAWTTWRVDLEPRLEWSASASEEADTAAPSGR